MSGWGSEIDKNTHLCVCVCVPCRVLMYGERYVFPEYKGREEEEVEKEKEEGEGEGEGGELDVENAEVGQLLPKERSLIRKLRLIKCEVAVSLF